MAIGRLYQQLKNIYHFLQAHVWRMWYRFPDKDLTLYGVTGTNGKTTTCHILAGVLAAAYGEDRVGMVTTINVRVGRKDAVNETKLTTLPSRFVYRYLAEMKRLGIKHVVIEMTSHALDQHRLAGIRLAGAIVTHIEREHLNYHVTMKEYVAAKAHIIKYLISGAPIVGSKNNKWVRSILGQAKTMGCTTILYTSQQVSASQTPLFGVMNQENALSARLLGEALGISNADIQRGIDSVRHVPGRMEEVPNDRGIRIIIDYAVTPRALTKLYQNVKMTTEGKIYGTLSAAGLRDRGKRPDMARAVATYTDYLVVTREDPWTEDEEQIFQDLEQGLTGVDISWDRIVDRKKAIAALLQRAQRGDAVVVTGKGAETGMGIGKKIVPYNEREVIEELLDKFG